ncbi:LexA family protein [Klebsiella aerogenes]|uniref:LexA family protein n=1 Tax=Klebsiella aerogenes TaxID=548 RepID=UPI0005175FA3|nr:S24 family peptidase [Klebsiella aerogenes]KZQ58478.1 peptidase S24 [Klebsiella aerogenes]HBV9679872.1 helix-turn-helix domain-containing protein [Klebsiella aerogenes]HBZ8410270.1 helix-turn-helix domain-containing protein [Klebsiella aerogenes]HCM5456937.1 helix-turn-helix domain-containing protein [Klebsiella aerogenes]HDU4533889.1 helix-turn-helix domain-containing protein [Klebsiella aerogenes]
MENKKSLTTEQLDDARRLKALYESKKKDLGITQYSIADELGITQGAVGHYLNGRNALNVEVASGFARILQVPISEFSASIASKVAEQAESLKGESNVRFFGEYRSGKRYPVLSSVQAGAWCEACEPYTVKDIDLWLESDAHIQGDAFWLKVEGDSMTAPVGISIPEGTFVLFDTGREPINGSLVIAKLSDSNEATFKKLIIDGGQKYLKGLNPAWPLVPVNGNCKILGVAIETKLRLI